MCSSRKRRTPHADAHGHDDHDGHHHEEDLTIPGYAPHESPWQMTVPLIILGTFAAFAGVLNMAPFHFEPMGKWLDPVFEDATKGGVLLNENAEHLVWPLASCGIAAFLVGTALAYWMYIVRAGEPAKAMAEAQPGLYRLLLDKWRIDELYEVTVLAMVDALADTFAAFDIVVVDGILARLTSLINWWAWEPYSRAFQTGVVHVYSAFMVVGLAVMGWFFVAPHADATVTATGDGDYTVQASPGMGYSYRWDANGDGNPDSTTYGSCSESREGPPRCRQDPEGRPRGDERLRLPQPEGDFDHAPRSIAGHRDRAEVMSTSTTHRHTSTEAPRQARRSSAQRELWILARRRGRSSPSSLARFCRLGVGPGAHRRRGRRADPPQARLGRPPADRRHLRRHRPLRRPRLARRRSRRSADAAEVVAKPESKTLLSWLIGLPLAGAVAILFLPRQAPKVLRTVTMLVMLGTIGLAIPLLNVTMGRGFHFNQDVPWLPELGIRYHVAIDGITLWLVMLTVFIQPVAAWVSFGSIQMRVKDWCFALLPARSVAMLRRSSSLDLFLFYVFWELMLVPMYVMIGVWGGANRIKSAVKFFLYTMSGSVLMLAAILYIAYTYARLSPDKHPSFDFFELQRLELPMHTQVWLFAAFALSFFIKVPMWPVHTWLPDAHTEAPTGGSIILAAVMLKMGTYGYLRFCMGLFPEASAMNGATLAGVAVLGGIIYGALCAWKQDDVKRLIAYSSVAHLGYVMLGLFACTPASLEGGVLQMVNHGISTGALFLLFGVIYDRRHTRQADDFGGLAKVMPVYATLFLVATLASIGLPGTNGFVGEFMVITGTFVSNKLGHVNGIQAVGAAIGVILGALYMLSVVQKMFFGPITRRENKSLDDINGREMVAVTPLILMIFVIGFFPNIFLTRMKDAVARVESDFSGRIEMNPAPKFYVGPAKLLARKADATPVPADLAAERRRWGSSGRPSGHETEPDSNGMALTFGALSPLLVIAFGAMLLMMAEGLPVRKRRRDSGLALGTTIVFAGAAVFAASVWMYGEQNIEGLETLAPWLIIDKFSLFFDIVLCLGGALSALLAGGYLPEHNLDRGEFYSLLLFSTFGGMMLAGAGDTLTVFLGLETMSIGAYAMTAFRRASARSAEGALKYFLLGSFAAALLVYGFAFLYGATGHTDLTGIGLALKGGAAKSPSVIFALVLILVALAFKVSAVPFHMWTPDAYEGAPTPATTYMAVAVKSGGFAMMLRVLLTAFGDPQSMSWSAGWPPVIAWLAVLTMTVANLIAGRQESVKRMLAYSSIAHAGYILVGVVGTMRNAPGGVASVLFYLLVYTVSTAGAFGSLILCGSFGKEAVTYEDLSGLGRRHPAPALAFSLFLFSLAGVPPTAGFFGKWFLFRGAIDSGFYALTIIAFINSVIGAYYYLRVLVAMYMREPAAGAPIAVPMRSGYVTAPRCSSSAILVLALGLVPAKSLDLAVQAATSLFSSS